MRRREMPGRSSKYLPDRGDYSFRQAYDCCDNLEVMFRERAEHDAEDDLESCYKVVVMTLLPVICSRVRAIFFAFALMLGIGLGALTISFLRLLAPGLP